MNDNTTKQAIHEVTPEQQTTLESIYHEYRLLRDDSVVLTDSDRGRVMAADTICHDMIEINCMLTYRKCSKRKVKEYLDRCIYAYCYTWQNLTEEKYIAAHNTMIEAMNKLQQIKTIEAF